MIYKITHSNCHKSAFIIAKDKESAKNIFNTLMRTKDCYISSIEEYK